jgi:crotonobetainyl-CoA:carnitine CoA-transferase CaiB-like acyl-CoA transferase
MGVGPLSDLTVLEVGGDVAVRYCGRLFARLGATVTRIGDDDDTRLGQGGAGGRRGAEPDLVWRDRPLRRLAGP